MWICLFWKELVNCWPNHRDQFIEGDLVRIPARESTSNVDYTHLMSHLRANVEQFPRKFDALSKGRCIAATAADVKRYAHDGQIHLFGFLH